jgi:hypothetical protein
MPCCRGDALAGALLSGTELPEQEVHKCASGRLYGFSVDEERIHIPSNRKSQSGSTRTSCPAASSARALFSLDAAIPSPATVLAATPSLTVESAGKAMIWITTRNAARPAG